MFENVKHTRNLDQLPNMTIDQKWSMVYNNEHIKWRDEKAREEQARKHPEAGQVAPIVQDSPEWYIKKFLDKTITAKQASGLSVSIRSKPLE
jgi:cytokinesis protein